MSVVQATIDTEASFNVFSVNIGRIIISIHRLVMKVKVLYHFRGNEVSVVVNNYLWDDLCSQIKMHELAQNSER